MDVSRNIEMEGRKSSFKIFKTFDFFLNILNPIIKSALAWFKYWIVPAVMVYIHK